jgi:hypothetical protein
VSRSIFDRRRYVDVPDAGRSVSKLSQLQESMAHAAAERGPTGRGDKEVIVDRTIAPGDVPRTALARE